MRASQERGRLAGEGHAKFTDKGQFRRERRREKKRGEPKPRKLKNVIFHLLRHDEISQDISN